MLRIIAILSILTLTSCASLTDFGGIKSKPTAKPANQEITQKVCGIWKPTTWSKQDTDQTIKEVKRNNAARQSWCKGYK